MDQLVQQLKELDQKLDNTLAAAHEAQKKAKEVEEKSANSNSTLQKAIEEATKSATEVQELKLKVESAEKTAKHIEAMMTRMPGTSDQQHKELEAKSREEMISYLRKRTPLSPEVVQATASALAQKGLHGVSDAERDLEVKTLMAGSSVDGGFWIRPERSATIIQRIFETSPMRNYASIQTTNSDSVELIIDDEEAGSGGWVGETEERDSTSTPKTGKITIPIHEQYAEPKATQKMLDDVGFDIESWLAGKVQRRMSRQENRAFVVGDGSQKPRGFLVYPNWSSPGVYQRQALERINSGSNGEFTADTVKLLQNSLIEEYQSSAIFALQRSSWQKIITLKDNDGNYLLDPRSMKVGDTMTLLGKPVVFMHDMQAAATGALAMAYGDFSVGYTVIDRLGFRVIRDNVTNKPNVKYYTTKRTGGDVTNYESIKLYQLGS